MHFGILGARCISAASSMGRSFLLATKLYRKYSLRNRCCARASLVRMGRFRFRLTQQSVCDSPTKIRALSNLEQVKQVDKQMIRWFNDVE